LRANSPSRADSYRFTGLETERADIDTELVAAVSNPVVALARGTIKVGWTCTESGHGAASLSIGAQIEPDVVQTWSFRGLGQAKRRCCHML